MTRNDLLLQKLANWRPDHARQTLTIDATDWRIDLTADAVDTLGIQLWEANLVRTAPVADPAPLADQAARIVNRVTGLMEPLRLVEIDAVRNLAQLRSTAPAVKGDTLYYYEILREAAGNTLVARFQATPSTGKRQQIAFTLTHEALAKLVCDLSAV